MKPIHPHKGSRLLGAVLLLAAATSGPARPAAGLSVGWRHENGVESRAVIAATAEALVHPRVRLGGGIAFIVFEHPGLSAYRLGARVGVARFWDVGLEAEAQHEQWNDWRVGENRVLALATARPLDRVELGIGAAWRAPLVDPEDYWSPFRFRSEAAEFNLVYRARWRALATRRGGLVVGLSNLDGLRLYTPHHVALQVDGRYDFRRGWSLIGHAGTALKGLSALIFSVGEFEASLGVEHDF